MGCAGLTCVGLWMWGCVGGCGGCVGVCVKKSGYYEISQVLTGPDHLKVVKGGP